MNKLLRILTAIFAICTAVLGFASYADMLPKEYAAVVGLVTAILLGIKEIVVVVGDIADDGLRNNSFRPDGKSILVMLLSLSVLSLASCSMTKQDAINYGERVGLFAGDAAILLAQMQLSNAEADLNAALTLPGANKGEIAMKRLAVATAKQALDAATRAIAKQRAKLDAKQSRDVTPQKEGGAVVPSGAAQPDRNALPSCDEPREQLPTCLRVVAVPDYGLRVAASLR